MDNNQNSNENLIPADENINQDLSNTDVIEIDGVKYKKINIQTININGQNKKFLSASDTANSNNINIKIIVD